MEKGFGEEGVFPECNVIFHSTTIHPFSSLCPLISLKCIPATLFLSRLIHHIYPLSQIELLMLLSYASFQKQGNRNKNRVSLSWDAKNIFGDSTFHPSLQRLQGAFNSDILFHHASTIMLTEYLFIPGHELRLHIVSPLILITVLGSKYY